MSFAGISPSARTMPWLVGSHLALPTSLRQPITVALHGSRPATLACSTRNLDELRDRTSAGSGSHSCELLLAPARACHAEQHRQHSDFFRRKRGGGRQTSTRDSCRGPRRN